MSTNELLRELTDTERLDARENARSVLLREIGNKPRREQFAGNTISEYPAWVRRLVAVLMFVVFVAAAVPSLFRLYSAGYRYHVAGLDVHWQGVLVGVSTFILAEFLIITSTLAASIFFRGRGRAAFVVPIGLGLAMAFVGNWTVVQPYDLFSWLETVAPPLAVLVMSFVGERLILESVRQAHEDERQYQQALADWQAETRDVESHQRWHVVYGRAIMQAIRDANTGGRGTKERTQAMNEMSRGQWAALVRNEMEIERGAWLTQPDGAPVIDVTKTPPKGLNGAGLNGMNLAPGQGENGYTPAMQSANGHTAVASANN